MFYQDYLDVNPASLDDNTNVYSKTEHVAYPSFEHVFNKTGVDMKLGIGENEAKAVLRYMTEFTMDTIKSLLPPETRVMLEFLIAKNATYRKAFIDTVCAVVSTTRSKGISDFLQTGEISQVNLPLIVQAKAQSNNLLHKYYTSVLPKEYIRSDY